jgi:hypothetical protein
VGLDLFGADFCDQIVSSSSYPISEIPVRASNPIARDVKFSESKAEEFSLTLKSDTSMDLFFLSQN